LDKKGKKRKDPGKKTGTRKVKAPLPLDKGTKKRKKQEENKNPRTAKLEAVKKRKPRTSKNQGPRIQIPCGGSGKNCTRKNDAIRCSFSKGRAR